MSCRKWEIQILRRAEGDWDEDAKARLSQHLRKCDHCRILAAKFSEIDDLFAACPEPPLPPFLTDKIVAAVSEAIRQEPTGGRFSRFFSFFASPRPRVVKALLVLGIVIGIAFGWNLAKSMPEMTAPLSNDLLSLAGLGGSGAASSLEFIWTDRIMRAGQ